MIFRGDKTASLAGSSSRGNRKRKKKKQNQMGIKTSLYRPELSESRGCRVSQIRENPQELLQHKRALILTSCTNTSTRFHGGRGRFAEENKEFKRMQTRERARDPTAAAPDRPRPLRAETDSSGQGRSTCRMGATVCPADLPAAAQMMSQSKQTSQSGRFKSPPPTPPSLQVLTGEPP